MYVNDLPCFESLLTLARGKTFKTGLRVKVSLLQKIDQLLQHINKIVEGFG